MVTQDTSQWINKKRGQVKQFLGDSIAELNLDIPADAEKVTLYDQRDGSKLVVPRYAANIYLRKPFTTSEIRNGTIVDNIDSNKKLFDWKPPSKIEDSVTRPGKAISKTKKRKRGKRGKR